MSEFNYSEQLVDLHGMWRVGGYGRVTDMDFEIILANFPYAEHSRYHTFGTYTKLQADEVESILALSKYGKMSIAEAYERIKNNDLMVQIQFAP